VTTAFISGSIWMIAMRWGRRLIGLISTLILARLLTPEDFGIVAMASTVAALLEMLAWTGVDLALIRERDPDTAHFNTAWTIKIIQGLIVAGLILLVSPLAAHLFDEPRVTGALMVLALRPVLEGFQNIGVVAFRKELDFGKEFRFGLYQKLLSFTVVIVLAVVLRSYWVMIIGLVSEALFGVLVSYRMHPFRPRLSLAKFHEIWSFSQWLLLSRIGFFLNQNVDKFVVGILTGTATMGSYHVAKEIATMFCNELVFPVRRALFPNLATLVSSPDEFRRVSLRMLGVIGIVALPVGFGMSAVAPAFVEVVLGDQWTGAVPLVQWLAPFGAIVALAVSAEVLLPVAGRSDLSAVEAWVQFAVLVPIMLWVGNVADAEAMAATRLVVALLFLPVVLKMVSLVVAVRVRELLAVLWRPALAAAGMQYLVQASPIGGPALVELLLRVIAGMLIYPLLLALLWWISGRPGGAEQLLMARVRSRIGARSSGRREVST
jgi:lipopolysaccharide exporter